MRPLPTTAITPGVTRIGRRLCASKRQNKYPGNSGALASVELPRTCFSVLQVGRKVSYPLPESKAAVEPSQRVLSWSAYHRSPQGWMFILAWELPLDDSVGKMLMTSSD